MELDRQFFSENNLENEKYQQVFLENYFLWYIVKVVTARDIQKLR